MNNKSNFNQALWLSIGQGCVFILAFITAPILARFLSKQEYGTYRQILYVYTTISTLFTLGLPNIFAYLIPKYEICQQKYLVNKLNQLFLFLGVVFSISLFLLSDTLASLLNNPDLAIGLKVFSPFPLFTLPALGVEGIYTALKKTKMIAIYQVVSQVSMVLCLVIPVVVFKTGYLEAVIGWGVASFIKFVFSLYLKNKPYVNIKIEKVPNMYREIFSYTLPLMGAFIAGFFVASADQFFVSRYYGSLTFADYANGCFSIPIVGVIAASVKGVLLPMFSKAEKDNKLNEATISYNNALKSTSIILIPILVFCYIFSEDIMVFLFGEQYVNSGSFFKVFIVRDFLQIFPYFAVLMALGFTKLYMNIHIIGALLIWLIDYLVISLELPAQFIVLVTSLFHVFCSVTAFIYIYKRSNINLVPSFLIKKIVLYISHCALCCLFTNYIVMYFSIIHVSLFLKITISGLLFYALIISTGRLLKINYVESLQLLIKK